MEPFVGVSLNILSALYSKEPHPQVLDLVRQVGERPRPPLVTPSHAYGDGITRTMTQGRHHWHSGVRIGYQLTVASRRGVSLL